MIKKNECYLSWNTPNWRIEEEYKPLRKLDRDLFRWAFLRRDSAYRAVWNASGGGDASFAFSICAEYYGLDILINPNIDEFGLDARGERIMSQGNIRKHMKNLGLLSAVNFLDIMKFEKLFEILTELIESDKNNSGLSECLCSEIKSNSASIQEMIDVFKIMREEGLLLLFVDPCVGTNDASEKLKLEISKYRKLFDLSEVVDRFSSFASSVHIRFIDADDGNCSEYDIWKVVGDKSTYTNAAKVKKRIVEARKAQSVAIRHRSKPPGIIVK